MERNVAVAEIMRRNRLTRSLRVRVCVFDLSFRHFYYICSIAIYAYIHILHRSEHVWTEKP